MLHTPFVLATLSVMIALAVPAATFAKRDCHGLCPEDLKWIFENPEMQELYDYDPMLFYSMLPSRARAFSLHTVTRDNYYKTFHRTPPSSGVLDSLQEEEDARACKSYTYVRPNYRVPPFGYRCVEK